MPIGRFMMTRVSTSIRLLSVRRPRVVPLLGGLSLLAVLVLTSCGDGGSDDVGAPVATPRVVEITMTDNAYSLTNLRARSGQEVTFCFRNAGSVAHEAVVGTPAQQVRHEKEMNGAGGDSMDAMADMGADPDAIAVQPGRTGEVTYQFSGSGTVVIGCHVPGHYQNGMRATITVT